MFHLVSFCWIRRTQCITSKGMFYKNRGFYLEGVWLRRISGSYSQELMWLVYDTFLCFVHKMKKPDKSTRLWNIFQLSAFLFKCNTMQAFSRNKLQKAPKLFNYYFSIKSNYYKNSFNYFNLFQSKTWWILSIILVYYKIKLDNLLTKLVF